MKLKCKLLLTSIFALSIAFIGQDVKAQHNHKHPHPKKKVVQHRKTVHRNNMAQSFKVIKRTNHVIIVAHKAVKKYKVYTGDLAKAVHHQRYAKVLLRNHKAHKAMQHSRLARKYAFKAIRSNKGTVNKEYNFNAEENKTMGETISDAELEKELKDNNPTVSFKDESISDKDMSDLDVIEMDPSDYKNE